jgi:hypothetical protein
MTGIPNPKASWQELHQAMLVETDREKLTELVGRLETAIVLRQEELSDSKGNQEERDTISLAIENLLQIQTESLGWPKI